MKKTLLIALGLIGFVAVPLCAAAGGQILAIGWSEWHTRISAEVLSLL
jgi:hypothetical protein